MLFPPSLPSAASRTSVSAQGGETKGSGHGSEGKSRPPPPRAEPAERGTLPAAGPWVCPLRGFNTRRAVTPLLVSSGGMPCVIGTILAILKKKKKRQRKKIQEKKKGKKIKWGGASGGLGDDAEPLTKRHIDGIFTDSYSRYRKQMAVKKYLAAVLGKRYKQRIKNKGRRVAYL
uniref:Glucagon / GIP / secretin / VIP family domain-containing protein n=1 Tax=Zonotrichia albicollis TaxID=44394 RepID=A0A8D2QE07_ZONAL